MLMETDWRPIDTAPREEDVLVYLPEAELCRIEVASLGLSHHENAGKAHYWWGGCEGNTWILKEKPTHWRPLPEPPPPSVYKRLK